MSWSMDKAWNKSDPIRFLGAIYHVALYYIDSLARPLINTKGTPASLIAGKLRTQPEHA